MALKATLEQWHQAVKAYDQNDFNTALDLFESIADSAKIHFNIGVILAEAGDHESAIKSYISALYLDQYLAIAYFQKGASNARIGEWDAAFEDFNDSLLYLRGNLFIDYKQLGLDYKLYSCEVLFNRGICYMMMGDTNRGNRDLETARTEKQLPLHKRIDQALERGWNSEDVFALPKGVLFRPDESKLKNSKKVDYLGKAKLIASNDVGDLGIGFKGSADRKAAYDNTSAPIPRSNVAYATKELDRPSQPPSPPSLNGTPRNASPADPLNQSAHGRSMSIGERRLPAGDITLRGHNALTRSPSSVTPVGRTTNLVRRNTDGVNAPRPVIANGGGGVRREMPPTQTALFTGKAALMRSDSRAKAMALARQNSLDRRRRDNGKPSNSPPRTSNSAGNTPTNPVSIKLTTSMSNNSAPNLSRSPLSNVMTNHPNVNKSAGPTPPKPVHLPSPPTSSPPTSALPNGQNRGHWNNSSSVVPSGKIKIKCHYKDNMRFLLVDTDIRFEELVTRVNNKFNCSVAPQLKYRDDDGTLVLVSDDEDFNIACGNYGSAEGLATRLELWCFD